MLECIQTREHDLRSLADHGGNLRSAATAAATPKYRVRTNHHLWPIGHSALRLAGSGARGGLSGARVPSYELLLQRNGIDTGSTRDRQGIVFDAGIVSES